MGGEEGGASGLNRRPRCPTSMSFVSGTTLQSFRRGKSSKCGKGGIVNKFEKGKEAGREGGRKEGEKREGVKQEERARKKMSSFTPLIFPIQPYFPHCPGKEVTAEMQREIQIVNSQLWSGLNGLRLI